MNYKKIIFIMTISTVFLMLLLMGGTYAYYSFGIGDNSTFSSNTISDIDISYEQGDYITTSLVPISDNYVYDYANQYKFSIIVDKKYSDYEIGYLASLINITFDEEINNWLDHFKYQIIDENNNIVTAGNFSEISDNNLSLNTTMITLNTDYKDINNKCYNQEKCNYNYMLKIWLSDDCTDSNDIKTCPNYNEQYQKYQQDNCLFNDNKYDCSLVTKQFIYDNNQNILQNKKIAMNIKIDTGLRK